MKLAKTIDELFEEVKDYDIVISNDAPLVTALNNRIDSPKIGRLASTPRMIAKDIEDGILESLIKEGKCSSAGRYGIMNDVRLLDTVSDVTGYDIRFVHGETENIRDIRKHREEVKNFLFGKPSERIYEAFTELPTYEMVMNAFDCRGHPYFKDKRVAVIGIDFFDDPDKHFIPEKYEEIDIFKNGVFEIGKVYAVGNDRQVAEHAADLITQENAEDIAIVMDSKGPIADAVRSALYAKGIPFRNTMNARDIVDVRDIMDFVRKALSYGILTVGDVKELFASYGASVNDRADEYLLHRYNAKDRRFRELSDLMKNIKEYTFSELCRELVQSRQAGTVRMVFDDLGLSDKKINEATEGFASYLIRSVDGIKHNAEIPESEKTGVVLADCLSSMFIDRPFVIYLNIDNAWSRPNLGKRYVDRKEEELLDTERFQVLLQQGTSKIYIVNTMKNGKAARPCTLFDLLRPGKKISSFADVPGVTVERRTWISHGTTEIKIEPPAALPKEVGPLSQSSINGYVACPRQYMFGRLVQTPDSEYTVFGSLLHNFAEFCLCYPDDAMANIKECAETISETWAGISCPERKELDRSKILMAVTNVTKFISLLNVKAPLNVSVSEQHKNPFFEKFSKTLRSDIAESDYRSPRYPLHGGFDLIAGNKIIDYKTGKAKDASDIIKNMSLNKDADRYDVQPLVYLSILDDILVTKGEREFVLFFAMDNETEASDPNFNVMRNTRSVILLDMDKRRIIRSGLLLTMLTEGKGTKGREFIKEFGDGFNNALLDAGIENASEWADDDALQERILSLQSKRTETVKKAIAGAIKKASEIISGCFISYDGKVLIPRETIDRFKEYAKEIYSRISEQQVSGFPYGPRNGCDKCGFLKMCTGGENIDAE